MGCATTKSNGISPEIPDTNKVEEDTGGTSSSTSHFCRTNSLTQGGPERRPSRCEDSAGNHCSEPTACSLTEFEATVANHNLHTTDTDIISNDASNKEDTRTTSSSGTQQEHTPRDGAQAASSADIPHHADPCIPGTMNDDEPQAVSRKSVGGPECKQGVGGPKQGKDSQVFQNEGRIRKSNSLLLCPSTRQEGLLSSFCPSTPKALYYDTPLSAEEQELYFRKLYLVDVGQHDGDTLRISPIAKNVVENRRVSAPHLSPVQSTMHLNQDDDDDLPSRDDSFLRRSTGEGSVLATHKKFNAWYAGHKEQLQKRYPHSATTEQLYRYFYEERFEGDVFSFQRQLATSPSGALNSTPLARRQFARGSHGSNNFSDAMGLLESLPEIEDS
eukprot:GEMP01016894.1.p1 GENE.GEMP01016894.1~~GEMP01016894.1.p1  ORF type:complete len:398 (+),score=64.12 GEMP01016894.1:36-1196(+)